MEASPWKVKPDTDFDEEFRVKSYGSDHKLARVSFYGARGVVGRGKSDFERYDSISLLFLSSRFLIIGTFESEE